jgi:hypothetical protein
LIDHPNAGMRVCGGPQLILTRLGFAAPRTLSSHGALIFA